MGATEEIVLLIMSLAVIAPFSYLLIRFLGLVFIDFAIAWLTAIKERRECSRIEKRSLL